MANVQLPSVNQGEQDMGKLVKQLLNAYIMLTEELTFLLNNLDTRNINEVDGDILVTGTVTAGKIAANSITADKMNVNELSAITANLGHITAGLIEAVQIFGSMINGGVVTGATVRTNSVGSKRVELTSNFADINIYSGTSGNSLVFAIQDLINDMRVWFNRDGFIESGREIHINAPNGVYVNNVRIG